MDLFLQKGEWKSKKCRKQNITEFLRRKKQSEELPPALVGVSKCPHVPLLSAPPRPLTCSSSCSAYFCLLSSFSVPSRSSRSRCASCLAMLISSCSFFSRCTFSTSTERCSSCAFCSLQRESPRAQCCAHRAVLHLRVPAGQPQPRAAPILFALC